MTGAAEDFDATAAAARALGDEPSPTGDDGPSPDAPDTDDAPSPDGPADPQDADGGGTGGGRIGTVRDRLLSTEPHIPLDSDELSTFDAESGGAPRIKRGLYKALGADGATALEDIALGIVEEVHGDGSLPSGTGGDGGDTDEDVDDELGALIEEGEVQ